jgi:hypothetical protein
MELFDVGPAIAIAVLVASVLIVIVAVLFFIRSAPPTHLTITTGPDGSVFRKNAEKYAAVLQKYGVKVTILSSEGSLENLSRLLDPHSHVDVGFVQGGITPDKPARLVSLGSISYQPILLFYRGKPQELLSGFAGKRVAIGPPGSGVRNYALQLLALHDIKVGGATNLLDFEAADASKQLLAGSIDAAFIMSESASTDILHTLLRANDIQLFGFKQASAYSRKIDYINVLELPEGSIDLGLDLPPHNVTLLGPMVEIIAVNGLHPALSDLLLEAAVEVHSHPGTYQKRGEFPTPLEHAIPLSEDATRYYQSGKSFLYRYMPFWLASLVTRITVSFLPMLVILIPALRMIPMAFRWRIQTLIRARYRELLRVEQDYLRHQSDDQLEQLRADFRRTEDTVNRMKVPASFADQFYGLRGHVDYVRKIISEPLPSPQVAETT